MEKNGRGKEELLDKLKEFKKIAVVGLAKNVGKTTAVNFLLRNLEKTCVVTIGRDGETKDLVFNVPKPSVNLPEGAFAVVPASILPERSEVCETFDVPSGKVALVRAKADVKVQTVRVGGFDATEKVADIILDHCDRVMIDGAFGRMGMASHADCAILVTGAAVGRSVEAVVEKTVTKVKKLAAPVADEKTLSLIRRRESFVLVVKNGVVSFSSEDFGRDEEEIFKRAEGADFVYIPGAITNETVGRLKCPLVVPSSDYVVADGIGFRVVRETKVVAVAANSTSISGSDMDSDELLCKLKKALDDIIVFDVLYEEVPKK